ncbi:MAG: bifunctional acetaldehyde-CoA/alcohol dehydrogenase [bacterium]|nr:bifunctional acetaldehyde-CoA/alcohol dehydrogenase [bacterium]
MMVRNLEELENLIVAVKKSQAEYAVFTQDKVNEIFKKVALAANSARIELAILAAEETGMGIVEDKVIKNHFAAEFIYNKYKEEKTCGVLEEDFAGGIQKIAEPIGLIAGVIPTTNPTSTTIFKALLALKTRNAIIFSPHPRAKKSTIITAKIMLEAAIKSGAPKNIIAWIDEPSLELTQAVMAHSDKVLATGGPGMVQAAYSSGTPAIGVGAGNTPAIIDESADINMAVNSIILSKTFDNGVVCASEQSVLVHKNIALDVKQLFLERGCYFLNKAEATQLGKFIIQDGKLNANIVGQSACKIATLAGLKNISEPTKILIAEVSKVGYDEPFAHEKLSPILAFYTVRSFEEGVEQAVKLVNFAGKGHTSVLYTKENNHQRINYFSSKISTGRVLINTPASQGAIGDIFNFYLEPSLTLGCGSWGSNSESENIGVKHLLNIKTVAERRENMLWFKVPPKIYFKRGCLKEAMYDLKNKKRAFIVSDSVLNEIGITKKLIKILAELQIDYKIFSDVEADPTLSTVKKGVKIMNDFKPDLIIAIGGGSPMDAAKVMWSIYENPDVEFDGLALRFMDIRKRIYNFPVLGEKAVLVAIPTTSGTGSEVTPFAVIKDDETHLKYPIADYGLTPNMAILDPELVLSMPPKLTAYSGVDALTHAIEAYASMLATPFTDSLAKESLVLIFKYLKRSYDNGSKDLEAKENMHYAANIAGMAFANAFLGVCHSMAHKLGSAFNIAHGLSNIMLINEIIKYNAVEVPTKQGTFSQYKYLSAKKRYEELAEMLGGKGVDGLINLINHLKKDLGIPLRLRDLGIKKEAYFSQIEEMSNNAFDDQCTSANPRYPLIKEIKEIYAKIW